MESYEAGESHPYGVLPAGNMYFAPQGLVMARYYGLGPQFCKLQDETIAELLTFLCGTDLIHMLQVSRVFYCYANSSDLWRDITLREFDGKGVKYTNSWKDAYILTRIMSKNGGDVSMSSFKPHAPIQVRGVFSNFLHRSWSCHTCDLETACPGFFKYSDIPVRSAKDLSVEAFIEQYELPNKPVVIRDAMLFDDPIAAQAASRDNGLGDSKGPTNTDTDASTNPCSSSSPCAALTKWTNEYLAAQCGPTRRLRATSAAAPLPAHFTADEYFQYAAQAKEEAPLYLFERNFASIAPGLLNDYEIPKYFRASTRAAALGGNTAITTATSATDISTGTSTAEDIATTTHRNRSLLLDRAHLQNPDLVYETDLFKVLGETARPDYRWLVAGPARSGSLFHIDPNNTNAWNLCIRGRKKWIFYPPGVAPPGVECSPDGADVVVPISTGEWLLTFWKYHLQARADPDPTRRPLEVILHPGEVMFVPHGYWHMVVNLEESIALTHNYVSTSNLSDCLRFLRDKTDQISGVRDRGAEAIQPEEVYTSFIQKLTTVLPAEVVQRHIAESLQPVASEFTDAIKTKMLQMRGNSQKRKNKRHFADIIDKTNESEQKDFGIAESEPKTSAFSFGFAF